MGHLICEMKWLTSGLGSNKARTRAESAVACSMSWKKCEECVRKGCAFCLIIVTFWCEFARESEKQKCRRSTILKNFIACYMLFIICQPEFLYKYQFFFEHPLFVYSKIGIKHVNFPVFINNCKWVVFFPHVVHELQIMF